jgi:hypothetical protein
VPVILALTTPPLSVKEKAIEGLLVPPVRLRVSSVPSEGLVNVSGCAQVRGAEGTPCPSRVRHRVSPAAQSFASMSNLVAEIGRLLVASLVQFSTRTNVPVPLKAMRLLLYKIGLLLLVLAAVLVALIVMPTLVPVLLATIAIVALIEADHPH